MNRTFTAVIPHQLGEVEARRRIKEGFGRLRQNVLGGIVGIEQRWCDSQMSFEGTALGQSITGRIEVKADAVQIEVDLPRLLAVVAKSLTTKLTTETTKLLQKQSSSPESEPPHPR